MEIPQPGRNGRSDHELRNLHALGLVIARSAFTREESRGSHYRSDFPFRDDEKFQKHSLVAKDHDVTYEE
jgi:succinate dehydrogenase/fumarate reductase flavoprotein subunit